MTESGKHEKRHVSPGWLTTGLTMILVPLMVGLGFWQLDRAGEKRHIQKTVEERQSRPVVELEKIDSVELPRLHYQTVSFSGQWQPQVFLLDNQVQNGKVGYHVISPVKLGNGRFVLVNRGWVAMSPDRRLLPELQSVVAVEVTGEVYATDDLIKDAPIYAEQGWPRRVQRLHLPGLSRELGVPLLPVLVRLQADSPGALYVQWSAINMLPEKHEAYAIQWFAMSVALIIFYTLLGFRANNQ